MGGVRAAGTKSKRQMTRHPPAFHMAAVISEVRLPNDQIDQLGTQTTIPAFLRRPQ
jgi:hypothetical protein